MKIAFNISNIQNLHTDNYTRTKKNINSSVSFNGFGSELSRNNMLNQFWDRFGNYSNYYGKYNYLDILFENFSSFKSGLFEFFKEKTGFPNLKEVSKNINRTILNSAHKQEEKYNTRLLFAGYDKNNSVGRELALPGSDCDGMFFIYDNYKHPCNNDEMRWAILYDADKRLIKIGPDSCPEVFTISDVREGIELTNKSFKMLEKELTVDDIKRFQDNINYDGKDFVKSGEFNIRLSKFIPKEKKNFAAMISYLAEYLRNGKILENNLDNDSINFIKQSSLYKYGNITRQEGLSQCKKSKHYERINLTKHINEWDFDKKIQLVKDIILETLNKNATWENKKYFINGISDSEMGNIVEMYELLRK